MLAGIQGVVMSSRPIAAALAALFAPLAPAVAAVATEAADSPVVIVTATRACPRASTRSSPMSP
jgi:hypothetical protein